MKVKKILRDNIIDDLHNCVLEIRDEEIRDFVNSGLELAAPQFWEDPASSSGRYHPPENNQECGTLIHTVKAFTVAKELFAFFGVTDEREQDIVKAAVILHDIAKRDDYKRHGAFAAAKIRFKAETELDEYTIKKILDCIEVHMSRWSPYSSLAKASTPTKLERITQLADFIASRKSISFYPLLKFWELEE